jgi:hypothetical protein
VNYLVEAILILEHGLEKSKFNFHMKLLLIGLYSSIGGIRPCVELFRTLDLKHVLLDTLSYIGLDDTICLAFSEEALTLCNLTQHFHDDNKKQVSNFSFFFIHSHLPLLSKKKKKRLQNISAEHTRMAAS